MMKRFAILIVVLAATGCGSAQEPYEDDPKSTKAGLMNAIENRVELPAGSKPLDRYARTYKFASANRISAAYFIPDTRFINDACQSAKSGGSKNGQIVMLCPPPDGMKAGERRWFDRETYLPAQSDGGCSYIEIEYSITFDTVITIRCNGNA